MNKDKTGGLLDEAKGRAKKITGRLVGNETFEPRVKSQHIAGTAQAAYGELGEKRKEVSANK